MPIVNRRIDERIVIGEDVTVLDADTASQVRIGADAPRDVAVHREEVYEHIRLDNPAYHGEQLELLTQAKRLAKRYRDLTGRALGIIGEIAEAEAARLLDLELVLARRVGYEAIRRVPGGCERLQIKSRVLHPKGDIEPFGTIGKDKAWDAMLLVVLDQNYDATLIFEASRYGLMEEMTRERSHGKARARDTLAVRSFCRIAEQIWPPTPVPLEIA